MSSFDAAKASLDQALTRLREQVALARPAPASVDSAIHEALRHDHELLRQERDRLSSQLAAAQQRMAMLVENVDELGRRLQVATAKVERLMEG